MKMLVHRLFISILVVNVLSLGILPEVRAALACELMQDEMGMNMDMDGENSTCDCPDSCAPQKMQVNDKCYKACYAQGQYHTVGSSVLPAKHEKAMQHRQQAPPDTLILSASSSGKLYGASLSAPHIIPTHTGTDTYLLTQRLRI